MTLDAGIHHLGTKMSHNIPAFAAMGVGIALDVTWLQAFAAGMLVVNLYSNMRCRAPHYRWRVREPGPREGDTE